MEYVWEKKFFGKVVLSAKKQKERERKELRVGQNRTWEEIM